MRPKSLSATSLKVADLCMKRFEAEFIEFGKGMQTIAAGTGSAVHGALETFMDKVFLQKTEPWDLSILLSYYQESYHSVFQSSNYHTEQYLDGAAMLEQWFNSTDMSDREIITLEQKYTYQISLSDGTTIPFNYIMDRHDKEISTGYHVVVDYKSNRFPMTEAELFDNLQARFYALMIMIKYPDAPGVWVEFDLLRHRKVRTLFKPRDCAKTWAYLMGEVARILATPADPMPTLNPQCNFCVLKTTCPAVLKNVAVGGVMSLSPVELVDRRLELESQMKASKSALEELDSVLGPLLRPGDGNDNVIEGTHYRALVTSKQVRNVDSEMVAGAVPEVFPDYVKPPRITMGEFDKMLKDERLSPEQISALKSLVRKVGQGPSITLEKM